MPQALVGFLIDMAINLAIKFGLPWVLMNASKIPFVGKYIAMVLTPEVIKVIQDFLESLKQTKYEVRAIKRVAVAKRAGARKQALAALKTIKRKDVA